MTCRVDAPAATNEITKKFCPEQRLNPNGDHDGVLFAATAMLSKTRRSLQTVILLHGNGQFVVAT
jgi:hypothetical protein